MSYNVIGRVVRSDVRKDDKGIFTDLETIVEGLSFRVTMQIRGGHPLHGRTVIAYSDTCNGIPHIAPFILSHYEVLDDKGQVIHSDISD